ncbi:MAG: hypothetical protein U0169_24220 [Polyangiaceae bacterium]
MDATFTEVENPALSSKSSHAAKANRSIPVAAVRDASDDEDLKKRIPSLFVLLALYTVGLTFVAFLPDGGDVGVLLAAIFGHVVYVAIRSVVRSWTSDAGFAYRRPQGLVVVGRKNRIFRYRDIDRAAVTQGGARIRLRGELGEVALEGLGANQIERKALVEDIEILRDHARPSLGRVRTLSADGVPAANLRESLAILLRAPSNAAHH